MTQGFDQAIVVALMQTDRWLIQHVHDTSQAGTDLRSQPDPLRFAARQGVGAAFQRQVIESDVIQEGQARNDFLDDAVGNFFLGASQFQLFEERQSLAQRRRRDFVNGAFLFAVAHLDETRFNAQPCTVAGWAFFFIDELGQFFLDRHRICFAVTSLQIVDHAFKRVFLDYGTAALIDIAERNGFLAGAVQHSLLRLFRQLFKRYIDVEIVVRRDVGQHLEVELVASVPTLDRAAGQRQVREGDDTLRIEEFDMAQAIAFRTRAHRIIKREQPRLQLLQRITAGRAGELVGVHVLGAAVHFQRNRAAFSQAQCGFKTFRKALLGVCLYFQAIDHHIDGVFLGLLQLGQIVDFINLGRAGAALDTEAHKTLRLHLFKQVDMLALAISHHRRQDHQLGIVRHRQHRIHHLRHRLRRQRFLRMIRAIRRADACVQQTQIVVDLGDRANGGARIVRSRFLFDRNRRRQTFDQVDIRFLHQLQELPGVGRQRFNIAPLTFRIQRIKCQRRFAGAGQAGDHDQFVAR